jgi:hypothetical protein
MEARAQLALELRNHWSDRLPDIAVLRVEKAQIDGLALGNRERLSILLHAFTHPLR